MSNGICAGCGGRLGRDCWNEQDCVWISNDMAMRAQQPPDPCQGCSMVTDSMTWCLGACSGLTSQEDADARAAAWKAMLTTTAASPSTHTPRDTETAAQALREAAEDYWKRGDVVDRFNPWQWLRARADSLAAGEGQS